MKIKALILSVFFMIMLFCASAVSAEVYMPESDYLVYSDYVQGDYVRICGRDNGGEPGMFFQSDSYAVVGENGEYVFALVYERNKGDKEKALDFPVTGLYTNDEENKLIYSLPEMEC